MVALDTDIDAIPRALLKQNLRVSLWPAGFGPSLWLLAFVVRKGQIVGFSLPMATTPTPQKVG
jgi:hypothetical protein